MRRTPVTLRAGGRGRGLARRGRGLSARGGAYGGARGLWRGGRSPGRRGRGLSARGGGYGGARGLGLWRGGRGLWGRSLGGTPPHPPSAPTPSHSRRASAAAASKDPGAGATVGSRSEPPPPPWGTALRGKTSSGSTPTSPTPTGAGRSWVRSGPRPVMCVRGLPPPGRALPARAPHARGRPRPVTSRLSPRPTAARTPRKGPRGQRPALRAQPRRGGGGRGQFPLARRARPPSGRRRHPVGARVCGEPVPRLLGRPWGRPLLGRPPRPGGRRCLLPASPHGAGRGPGASGVHAPAIGRGRRRPVPGAGPRPGRSEPWGCRMGPASRALTRVVALIFITGCDARADSSTFCIRPGTVVMETSPVRRRSPGRRFRPPRSPLSRPSYRPRGAGAQPLGASESHGQPAFLPGYS